jgi:hypothetical protein
MLNQETLKKYLTYDPETGLFRWKIARRRIKAGEVAGCLRPDGYVNIMVLSKKYLAHRLAWLYVHGKFAEDFMDHINGIKNDNRIINLRSVTRSENQKNMSLRKNSISGVIGVAWNKRDQVWQVNIQRIGYGSFKSKSDAIKKSKEVYKELGFHENHGKVRN